MQPPSILPNFFKRKSSHCIKPLHQATASSHCIKPLHQATASSHCIKPPIPLSNHHPSNHPNHHPSHFCSYHYHLATIPAIIAATIAASIVATIVAEFKFLKMHKDIHFNISKLQQYLWLHTVSNKIVG